MSTVFAKLASLPGQSLPAGPSRTERSLERGLTGLCLFLIAALLALWLPNYLRWPLFWDSEHFAQMAREWDAGMSRPYRDAFSYNWPGPIYLYWIGGKLFGWGQPCAVQLMDVLLLAGFGVWTLVWSRRRFGRYLPGTVAFLGLLAFYMQCNFRYTAQRSWHAALFAAAAAMAPQVFRGLRSAPISGALLGVALLFRPDLAVWGPVCLVLLVRNANESEHPLRRASLAVLAWTSGLVFALALGLLPLWAHGLLGDFLHAFRMASTRQVYDPELLRFQTYARIFGELPYYEFLRPLARQLFLIGLPILWGLAAFRGGARTRGELAPWVWCGLVSTFVAFRLPLFYEYLLLPVFLAAFLSLAPTLAALTRDLGPKTAFGVALLVLVLVPGLPRYCVPKLARDTYAAVLSGRRPEAAPVFLKSVYRRANSQRKWDEYRACVRYLHDELPADLAVVNALDPDGELSKVGMVYPSNRRAGGGANALLVPPIPSAVFEQILHAVEKDPKTAVLLTTPLTTPRPAADPIARKLEHWKTQVQALVHAHYQPAARFGAIEVWVRKNEEAAPTLSAHPGEESRR